MNNNIANRTEFMNYLIGMSNNYGNNNSYDIYTITQLWRRARYQNNERAIFFMDTWLIQFCDYIKSHNISWEDSLQLFRQHINVSEELQNYPDTTAHATQQEMVNLFHDIGQSPLYQETPVTS